MEMFYSLLVLLVGWVCFVFAITNIMTTAFYRVYQKTSLFQKTCGCEKCTKKFSKGWKIFKMLLNALALTVWYYIAFFLFPALTLVL